MKAFFAGALVLALPCVAMAQIAVLQIKVLDGEGAVHPAGAHITHPLTVEVTDETGRPVAGAAVSFQLPPEGPSGLFSNGLRTDLVLTDSSGHASIHSVQLNRAAGQFRIRITAVKEQARAGAVATQYIGEDHSGAQAGAAAKATPVAVPQTVLQSVPQTTAPQANPQITATQATAAQTNPQITATQAKPRADPQTGAKSGEITPTTTKMGSGSHKKWIILAVIVAAGAGAAFLGVSRAKASQSSTVSSSVVSIGTPAITIGNP
jgi:hypothetical protein